MCVGVGVDVVCGGPYQARFECFSQMNLFPSQPVDFSLLVSGYGSGHKKPGKRNLAPYIADVSSSPQVVHS